MDKSDQILSAIEKLAGNLSGQIAEVRAEVKAVDTKVDGLRAEVAELRHVSSANHF